jgi:Raf kinase inhibitor-like YbhB/YbcL family protein
MPLPLATARARPAVRRIAAGLFFIALMFCASLCAAAPFSVTSADLADGAVVPASQLNTSCGGHNMSPQLAWHNPPAGTAGYAITIYDPDAPGRGWWHWAVANLPPSVTMLPTNASANGAVTRSGAVEARNDFGDAGYGGPCPPAGKPHRYVITVYALKTADLTLASGRPAQLFEHEIDITALARASITVRFQR